MKITVVGRGNVGGGLGRLWERAGHELTRLGRDGGDLSDAEPRRRIDPVRVGGLDRAAAQERAVELIFAIGDAGLGPFFYRMAAPELL